VIPISEFNLVEEAHKAYAERIEQARAEARRELVLAVRQLQLAGGKKSHVSRAINNTNWNVVKELWEEALDTAQ
jgi:hypothetical protein